MTPLASILVPVYNSAPFLPGLLDCVRKQTYANWELILVDDASSDDSKGMMEQAAAEDQRIKCAYNERNSGPSATLNRAAELASGELLFRLDADDTMVEGRLRRQVDYLENNPNTGLLGSAYVNVDEYGRRGSKVGSRLHRSPALTAKFLFTNAMGHSTVVYRKSVFRSIGGYDESMRASLDYDLLARLSLVTECAFLPDVLIHYKTHTENISTNRRQLQRDNARAVQQRLFRHYGFTGTDRQLDLHAEISFGLQESRSREGYIDFIRQSRAWLTELRRQNTAHHVFPPADFDRVLAEIHTRLFARAASPLLFRDYLRAFTADFGTLRPENLVLQVGHALKRGL